jgi:FKBP12-rapamycin complex-associated protein
MQKGGPTDAILGSMLAFGAMLQNQHPVHHTQKVLTDFQVMDEFFQPICEATLKYRESREVVIRKAVITLLPNMATFDPDRFEDLYLKNAMSYILQALHKATDRDIGKSRRQLVG